MAVPLPLSAAHLAPELALGLGLAAGLLLLARHHLRALARSHAELAGRLGLQQHGSAARGELAGRQVEVWAEHDPVLGEHLSCVRVDLGGALPADLRVEPALLAAWVDAAQLPAGPGAPGAQLDTRVTALLEAPEVQPLLSAFVRANQRSWVEGGWLCAARSLRPRGVRPLERYVEEALALAIAVTSAAHRPAQRPQAAARAG